MKNIVLILITTLGLLIASCNRSEIDYIFGQQPEERIAEKLEELKSALLSSPYGWKGVLNTNVRGGYGFYMNFNTDETVDMLSDFNATASSAVQTSTWRVKWGMDASLIFDTYNYITLLQDPNPSVNGGTGGQGLQSDIEFEYVRINQDSIILKGKRYKNELMLTKLSESQQQLYLNEYSSRINTFKANFDEMFNPYIELPGINNKVSLTINPTTKTILLQYLQESGEVKAISGKFAFDLNGLTIIGGLAHNDEIVFQHGVFEDDSFYLLDSNGTQYDVKLNDTPILPIENLFGYNKTYKSIGTPTDVSILPDISINSSYLNVWNQVKNNFVSSGRSVRHFTFAFSGSRQIIYTLAYAAGATNYIATVTFDYTYEDGILTLSNPAGHTTGNWNTRRAQIQPLETYLFLHDKFVVDWVPNPTGTPLVGFYAVDDPDHVIYGYLQ